MLNNFSKNIETNVIWLQEIFFNLSNKVSNRGFI